ncbi:unnamed protein product [Nezara viridula]|uniref:Uncharacterized protein n=1 Tax=Nezara viridula TaxID=85310 RepID=A0A9P0HB64_NEZVI|nr:unnamed protein product [Nezara viridula]
MNLKGILFSCGRRPAERNPPVCPDQITKHMISSCLTLCIHSFSTTTAILSRRNASRKNFYLVYEL